MYPCSIWGPTCDGLDRIVEQCDLPELQLGDWLVFENMGAYTVAASSTFNGFQRPDIHYVMSRHSWYVVSFLGLYLTVTCWSTVVPGGL